MLRPGHTRWRVVLVSPIHKAITMPEVQHENLYERRVESVAARLQQTLVLERCPSCDGREYRPTYQVPSLAATLAVCAGCGLGRLHPQPGPDEIAAYYPPDYYGAAGSKFISPLEWLLHRLARIKAERILSDVDRRGPILDVGCGRGLLLSAFADLGHPVHGFEVSSSAVAGIDSRVEVCVARSLLEADYPTGSFECVILSHVLEHLPNPREVLALIYRLLVPGGRLLVAVPNFSSWQARWAGPAWFHLDLPRHLFHFPAAGLKQLLESIGFQCRAEWHWSLSQNPFGWIQSGWNKVQPRRRNCLYHHLHAREQVSWGRRSAALALVAAASPAAILLSLCAALRHQGATIEVLAERGTPRDPAI